MAAEYQSIWTGAEIDAGIQKANNAAPKENGVFFIEGTGSTAGKWLGSHDGITEYYDGLMIAYKVGIAGASGLTLNINNLGAVSVVRNVSTAVTTHYGVNSIVFLTYTVDSSGTAYWKTSDYDSDTKTRSSNKADSKMFIIGATAQSTSGQTTYSNSKCYIGSDNCLYSNGEKVSVSDTNTTYQLSRSDDKIVLTGSDGSTTYVTDGDTNTTTLYFAVIADGDSFRSTATYNDIYNAYIDGCSVVCVYDGYLIPLIGIADGMLMFAVQILVTVIAVIISQDNSIMVQTESITADAIGAEESGTAQSLVKPVQDSVTTLSSAINSHILNNDKHLTAEEKAKLASIGEGSNVDISGKLDKAGGTVTGNITFNNSNSYPKTLGIKWGTVNSKTPYIGTCSSSSDGTFVIGSLAGTAYNTGLSIGGSSGNLLWKGKKVATADDIATLQAKITALEKALADKQDKIETWADLKGE